MHAVRRPAGIWAAGQQQQQLPRKFCFIARFLMWGGFKATILEHRMLPLVHAPPYYHHHHHHQGFEKTGLGERIATLFVRALGKSTLGLSIGLNVAEALMAPAMPSTSARAGGIFVPIIKSLASSAGSEPGGYLWGIDISPWSTETVSCQCSGMAK